MNEKTADYAAGNLLSALFPFCLYAGIRNNECPLLHLSAGTGSAQAAAVAMNSTIDLTEKLKRTEAWKYKNNYICNQ